MKNKQGRIFIISGPAGVGKDTIIKGILKKHPNFVMVKSYTTRPKRKSDEGGNRYFISEKEFKDMVKKGETIEWAKVHAWYYGRKKSDIVRHIQEGRNVIIEVDVQGALHYATHPRINADMNADQRGKNIILIFIKYESPDKFIKRIKKTRPEISKEELAIRKKSMEKEMRYEKYYDYSVVNPEGHPEKAIEKVNEIITNQLRI